MQQPQPPASAQESTTRNTATEIPFRHVHPVRNSSGKGALQTAQPHSPIRTPRSTSRHPGREAAEYSNSHTVTAKRGGAARPGPHPLPGCSLGTPPLTHTQAFGTVVHTVAVRPGRSLTMRVAPHHAATLSRAVRESGPSPMVLDLTCLCHQRLSC